MAQDIQTPPADAAKENKTKRKVTYTPVRTVSGSELREMAGDGSGVLENEWNDPSVRTFTEDGFKGVYPVQPPEKYHTDEDLEEAMPTGNAAGIGANMVFSGGAIPPSVARELYKNETSRAGNTSGRYARMKEERAWRDNEAKYAVDSAIADGFKPDGTSMRNIQEKYVASYYYTAKGRDRYNRIKEETNRLKEYLTPYIEQETADNPLYQKAVADYRAGKISMEQLAETQEMLRRESPSYKKAAEWSMQQNRQYAREASDYFSPYIEKEMVPFMEQGLDKSISDFRSLQGEHPDEFTGVADNLLNKAEKLRDAARNGGFLTGMGDTASDWNFWSLGIADLYRAKNIREIADKADKALREGADVEFTPEELNTLQAYAIYQQALNLYSEKVPLSYTMGQVTAEMIPFATSIALGQGLVKLTTKGISAVAKKAATREVAQAVSQALGKSKLLNSRFAQGFRQGAGFGGETTGVAGVAGNMLGGMTRGTGEALTVGAPRTWAEKNERMTGQADIDVTDSGQPLITGFSGRESGGEAFAHALAGNAIEYQSERAGQLIDRLGGALKARLPKDLQLSMGSLGDYIKSITPKSLKRFYKSPYYKAFKDNIQLQGVWSEYGEEELANWERVLLGLDEPDVLLDNEQRVETFLSLLPAQLMMGAGAGVYSAGRYRQASARLDKLMKEMKASDPELYEKYGKVRGEMDGFDVKAVTGLLSSIDRDGKLNANQKTEVKRAALAEYYTKMLKSAQEAEIFGRADEEMKQAYEQAEALKERGSGNIVTADYEGRKVNITDDTGSDTVVIEYVDEDGKRVKRQVPRSAVGNAATVPVADVVNSKADEITARVKTEMQELEHPGVAAAEPGMRLVHNGENYAVTSISPDGVVIMREDEEGNNSLPEVISLDTYYAEKQAEIDAQEQQPQSGENGEAAQETASPAEEDPAPVSGGGAVQDETALGRMPKDEQGQPLYEQADAETAWDALLEQAGGDEAMAQEVANEIVSEQEKALKAAERELKKVQDGKPQQRKGDAPLTVEARIAAKQAAREQTSRAQVGVDEARKRLEAWRKIAETSQRRRQAIEAERRQEEQEAARLRGIQEEQERAEREEAERIRREALNGVPDFIEDRPQDARARGYRRVNGNRVDRQEPIQARRGGEVQVKFDDNNIPTGHTALIEASQLQPSHTDGRRNPRHFIDEAQPKERNDEASVMSARKIAANIRPEEITSSVTAYTGAPTVNSRGEVIQGNNRSAALREMWAEHPEQAAKYRQYLADHAADFGLTPEDVEAMQQPVLVNMLDVTDDAAITLGQFVAQDTESGGTERIKPKNMVQKMGDDMRIFAGKLLASADEEMSFAELVDRNGADVLKWMQQKGYITPTQYKSAFDSKGNLTAEAKNDLKGVMYQSIFQNGSSHLEEMFNALPAKAQKAILATAYRDYDSPNTERMIEEIQNSISAYHALSQDPAFAGAGNYKEARIAAEAWKRQYAFDDATGESYLPSERYSNFALLLATMYKGQTQKFIQNTLGHIYDLVQGTQEADLFNQPDNTPRTLVQAINETLGNLREELLLNENFTYNGQRRSNVLAGGSASGQRGRQGSDGNASSGGRAENGARTDDGSGRTGISDNERGRQGNITDIAGRQPDGLGTSEGEVRLSDEIDENGRQFVLTSNGQLSFGEITEESGLTPAPILLSEGIITNPATNDGYGLVHIEARHGDQIRKAGYKSVIEFIEDVAQNYERVKEGNIRNGNPTYLIQLKDKHNNTLIVELSSDGNYWNINTAGIFKESYGKNRREIYNRHTTVQQSAETVGASQEAEQSGTTTSSSMNAPTSNIVSETPVKTEPQQPNNAVSTGSSLSENEVGGITSSEPNGKPTVSESKDTKTFAETSQERQKNDSNLSEAFKQQMNIRIGQLSKFIKTKDGKLKKKYESLRKTPFFAIFDSGNIYEGPVAIAKTPREALNVAFNYDIGDFEVLYVDFRTKSLDMDLLSIYDVSGFRGDVYDENGAYKDEAKNLLVERISRLGKGNSTEVQGVEDFQQRESGADALQGNADENIRRAESEVERNPTEAQKEAGNYRKGHVRVDGLDVTIENPKGSVRSGTDADGKRWENVMNNTYGYMRGTEGVDGDHIDVFLSDNPESGNVYVVDQRDPKTGEFDEHKVMYGFGSMEEARDAYLKNYTPGWQGLGTITEVSKDEFRKWIGSSKRKTKPFAEYKSVKKEAGQNEDVRQSRDGSNPLSAEEAAIRDAIVERLRESGIEVITDTEAGQKVLDEANGRGEPVRTQALLDGLAKAASTIRGWIKGNRRGRVFTIDLPESTQRKIKEAMGRDFDSHNITANGIAHALKNHGVGGYKLNERSIPLREEDMELIPYIMTAPDDVKKASTDVSGRESVRFYKNLSNGYVVVVEKEYKNSPDDMETITMWAELSSGATNARQNAVPDTHVLNAIPSTDSAKIRKDAEDAIHGDEKVREHRVYHGSGADFEAFDHSHMGEGEGAQAYGWGSYVTEVEGIGRTYAKASTENKRENATVYKRRQIRDNEISINVIRGMIAEYPEQHREREKRLSDLEKELADQNSQKGRIEKESGKDSVAYRNFMFYAEDIIKDLERNIERTKRSIEDEAGYNEQRKRQVEELVAENARLQSEIDAIEAQYPRHLYTVEIPDDTGENYLEWEKPVTKEQQGKIYKQLRDEKMTIKGASQSFWNGKSSEWQSGQKLIDFFIENLGSDKAASEFLSRAGFTGISYPAQATTGGRKDGARNYVIFDEKDLQITDHVRFFRTPGGEAYGFTVGGKIYIDPRTTTADTPIHEYAHLWAGALRQANPKEWNNIVDLMRDTPAWDEVKRLYPELESDEEIADEALAMYSGRRGAERLREAARRAWDGSADLGAKAAAARAMGRVRDALRRFWQNVADLLHFRHISAEEVADRVMRDLMEGVNPNRIKSATDNTGAFSAGNDDIRYSRAEEDKSLVAVHNTSEENLKKALELGGFPMPSIAVTKADVGHTEFGEISLVFGRESIDPTDRRNKVYGEDAWTPTFPQTGYKLDEKKTNDIYRRANKAGSLPLFNPVTFHPDNYESYISGLDSKSLVEHFKDDYGAKQLYLYENGNAVDEWERHEVEKYLPDQVALSTKLLEEIGLERLKGEKDETLEYEVKRIVNDHYGIDLDGMPPFRAKIRIGNAISRAVDYAENGNRKTEADAEATKRKIDARTDQKDFEKWLEDLFDGIVEKRGIRNDKDPFTASGNRRKWEQLYDEITLDNVVEAMRRQAARGGQGLFGGSIFGAAQEEYKDIDSIRKAAKRRIRMMSHEEAETGRKTITDRLSAIEIPGVGERFSDVMDMVQNIQDAVARSHTAKGIYKYLKAFYPKVTMETANEIADIVKDIQAMSARYFEAKPYRAVGFDEVRLAVVPSDTDAGLVEQLKRKGIPVREYERGNEAERRAIVEEATDEMELRFRETEEEDANRRFNEELEAFKEKRHKGLLHIGVPGNILMACGVNADLTLSPTVLHRKLKQHGLSIEDIRNLPEALQHPIMVYRHGDKHPNLVVVTDMEAKGGKISAAIELNADGNVVEINNISSIHSKDASKELNRLAGMRDGFLKQALRWVDKEKVSDWLGIADLNSPIHASDPKLVSVANIVKDFENPALEDENLFRIGETKRIGGDSLFGRRITFTRTNPTVTLNAMKRWVLKNADLKEYDVARTGSRYLSFTHNGVDYKIRSANHTRAYDGNRPENSGLSVSVEDRIYGVEIDLAENEMVKEDILRIIEDTDRLNDTGLNLQNTVESGLLPDEMVSADRELTDAVIREVREMAEWRLDSARTKAESEYEREHPLEDYKADNGIMILNRYFYGRVSYEVKFPDGWRGKTKQPRADAIQEYEDSDAHRRNMEQASGMNVYVDGRTKAQAETLRKIDGLANRLEQERMAGAVREMAERLHLEGVEVVTDASTLTGRRARAKGFYSPRTGKISIVIPNHASEADAVQTLLHEAVAHKGLRQLFGEHFDTFLWNVYRNADRDVRERINALASDKGWDFPTATEEYLASLAENTDFENAQRSGWWEKIKRLFIDMLHKMGLDRFSGVTLSDNELRYILWRSYENLREPGAERSITGVAADVVKQAELKVGNYAEEATGGNMAAERGKKEASETDSVLEREHQHTVISDATGTKILNNLDNLVKRYENSAQSEIKTFIGEVSKAIGARRHGSKSEYATFETKNGKIITIRLSDHNASTRNFDNAGRNNGISIVITARKNNGVANDGNAHVVEFYYDAIKLRKTAGKPLAQIVRSIQQSLYSGEYHDTTGLAVRDEVNNDEDSLLFRDGSAAEDGTRDTPLSSPTIHAWDRLAQSLKFQLRETAVDYLTAIDKFQDLIAKHSGRKIESFENAYDWMTFLSSRNRVEMDMFDSSVVRPLNNAILKLTREKRRRGKWKWDEGALRELVMYVEAKHGTDRNRQMAVERYVEELPEQKREGTMAAWTAEKKRINSQNISWIEKQRQLDAAAARIGADIEQDYSGLSSIFGDTEQYPGGWREESLIYAADYEAVHENADIASLWNAIDAATGFALRKQYETGLVSREYVDRQRERFEHYIPLRGFSDETAGDVYSYIGHDFYPGGNPVKTAHGRMSEAGNPFGSMLNIAYSSISAGNKNMAKTALYALVRNHDTDGLAVVNRAWMVRYDKLKEMPELSDVVTMPTFEAGEETPKWVEAVPRIPEAATSDDITRIMSKFEDVMTEYRKEDFTKPIRKNNKTAYRTLNKERSEHDIPLFIAGEKYVITVTGNPRPAQAMNGLLNPDVNEDALSELGKRVQRFMAGAFTGKNAAFSIANLFRDTIYANNQMFIRENPAYWLKFTRNQRLGFGDFISMMRRLKKFREGTLGNSKDDRLFQEFMQNGGATGYTFVNTQEEYARELAGKLDELSRKTPEWFSPKGLIKLFFDAVQFAGESAELVNRFAAYKTSREMGRTMGRSIRDAKEITVNFNRKGAGRKSADKNKSWYSPVNMASAVSQYGRCSILFWNANMQGKYRFYKNMTEHPVKTSVTLIANNMALAAVVLPLLNNVALPMLYELMGLGDDGDDENYFNVLTDWERTHNICVRLPKSNWLKIPISPDFVSWFSMGDAIGGQVSGEREMSAKDFITAVIDAVSPLSMNWSYEGSQMLLNFAPTVTQPLLQNAMNVNFMGNPLKKTPYNSKQGFKPEYQMVYSSASPTLVELSRLSNRILGGTDLKTSGWADWNPAELQNLISGYTGGYGTTFLSAADWIVGTAKGEKQAVTFSRMPLVSRFAISGNKDVKLSRVNSRFYDVKNFVDEFEYDLKSYEDAIELAQKEKDAFKTAEYAAKREELIKSERAGRYQLLKGYVKAAKDCEDYLEELPEDEVTRNFLYNLKQEAINLLYGEYKKKE